MLAFALSLFAGAKITDTNLFNCTQTNALRSNANLKKESLFFYMKIPNKVNFTDLSKPKTGIFVSCMSKGASINLKELP